MKKTRAERDRAKIEADTAAYLARGGEITALPDSFSGMPELRFTLRSGRMSQVRYADQDVAKKFQYAKVKP